MKMKMLHWSSLFLIIILDVSSVEALGMETNILACTPNTFLQARLGGKAFVQCFIQQNIDGSSEHINIAPLSHRIEWFFVPRKQRKTIQILNAWNGTVAVTPEYTNRVKMVNYPIVPSDGSIILTDLRSNNSGTYYCQAYLEHEHFSSSVDIKIKANGSSSWWSVDHGGTNTHVEPSPPTLIPDLKLMVESEAPAFNGVVFFYRPIPHRSTMTFAEAVQACDDIGAVIASPEQLREAQKNGLHQCDYGWLQDQTVRIPIVAENLTSCPEVEELGPGVQSIKWQNAARQYDVYCFVKSVQAAGNVFSVENELFSYDEAVEYCQKLGSSLASPAQLSASWDQGSEKCVPGWLVDRSIRIPIISHFQCGNVLGRDRRNASSYITMFPVEDSNLNAYCFKGQSTRPTSQTTMLGTEFSNGFNKSLVSQPLYHPSMVKMSEGTAFSGVVFFYRPTILHYNMTFEEAVVACDNVGAVIASPEQLRRAQSNGLHQCNYGWLQDLTVRMPITTDGLRSCPEAAELGPGVQTINWQKATLRNDVYCFAKTLEGRVFSSGVKEIFSYKEAVAYCQKLSSTLASPAQLSAAWKQGFDKCVPGWLMDHSVRFPILTPNSQCGSVSDGGSRYTSYLTMFPDEAAHFNAYCFQSTSEGTLKPGPNMTLTVTSEAAAFSGVVFSYRPNARQYTMTFSEAVQACRNVGAVIASPEQLKEAQKNGLHQCNYGWLRDKSVRYSVVSVGMTSCPEVGEVGPGVQSFDCTNDWMRFDVYCFVDSLDGRVFYSDDKLFSYNEAVEYCQTQNSTLASPAQLSAAWKLGFDRCGPGWLTDRSVRYPITAPGSQCPSVRNSGSSYNSSYLTGFNDEDSHSQAYCFEERGTSKLTNPKLWPELEMINGSEAESFPGVVFFSRPSTSQYTMTFPEALQFCINLGAFIASPEQLSAAHKNGLHQCDWGWLQDQSVRNSLVKNDQESCTKTWSHSGVKSLGWAPSTKSYDVYCYVEPLKGQVFLASNIKTFSYDEAVQRCAVFKSTLATPAQLSAAWSQGFNKCVPGWLKDRSVRFTDGQCGGGHYGAGTTYGFSYKTAFPTVNLRLFAYCFKGFEVFKASEVSVTSGLVFYYRSSPVKNVMNYHRAQQACLRVGTAIATSEQLEEANKNGLHQCDYGWLQDQTVKYPFGTLEKAKCEEQEGDGPGVKSIGWQRPTREFDTYCYMKSLDGVVIFAHGLFTYSKAVQHCRTLVSTLATPGQLSAAWRRGFDECRPGWLMDGSVRFPSTSFTSKCGGANKFRSEILYAASYLTAFPPKGMAYSAYCFIGGEVDPLAISNLSNMKIGTSPVRKSRLIISNEGKSTKAETRRLAPPPGPKSSKQTSSKEGVKPEPQPLPINMSEAAAFSGVVFFYRPTAHQYTMTFSEAVQTCRNLGAVIASPDQLKEAQKNGLHQCNYGWLQDKSVRCPVVSVGLTSCPQVGEVGPGVRYMDCRNVWMRFDVYCFVESLNGRVFYSGDKKLFSYDEAVEYCQTLNSTLASPAQLSAAWKQGFDKCGPGWLKDRSVRHPNTSPGSQCPSVRNNGSSYASTYLTEFYNEDSRSHAYCFESKVL